MKDLLYKFFSCQASIDEEAQILDWLESDPENQKEMVAERKLYDQILMHAEPQKLWAMNKMLSANDGLTADDGLTPNDGLTADDGLTPNDGLTADDGLATEESRKELASEQELNVKQRLGVKKTRLAFPDWTRHAIRYAAVVTLIAGVGLYYISQFKKELRQATNTISVPSGKHVNVVLSDGTKICLNSCSTLEYPAFFDGSDRRVKLTGEAFFDVTHNKKRPFIVETFICQVEVLGTKFNVVSNPDNNEFATSLVEGKVKLTDNSDPSLTLTLTPNQQASYINNNMEVKEIPKDESFQWRNGIIAFSDATFMKLIDEFEKYYGIRIELQSNKVPTNLFTGKIRISEGIDHALWVLQQSCKFRYSRNESNDTIYIK